jgi:penicillin-binding protein 2
MKLMCPRFSFVGVFLPIFVLFVALGGTAAAQTKKAAPTKKVAAKKVEKPSKPTAKKDVKKGKETARTAKNSRSAPQKSSTRDKKKERQLTASEKKKHQAREKIASAKAKKDPPKSRAEKKREDAERRRKEAERRAAILAEKRRREAAAREARARAIAFERGLVTDTQANIARDLTEGEDLKIRAAAVKALGNNAGSVVVMEAQTGKVLTIVNQDWAVRSTIRPCSTIKLVTGAAGINEGVISKEDGAVRNTQHRLNLDDALARSENSYFQRVGAQLGNTKLVEYGQKLGLGQPTGINLEGEAAGRLPYNNSNARIYSHGDDTEVSTLQLAVMASAITNGGNRVLPRIPRNEEDNAKFQTFYKAKVEVPQPSVRRVIPGMMGAAEYGTARRNMDQSLGVAGKTGSCIDKGSWVGLFTSVAPIEQPKYAVAVITRGARARGRIAAAVAAQIYSALSPTIVRTNRNLAQTEFNLAPRGATQLATATAAVDDDEEGEETDTVKATLNQGGDIILVPAVPKNDPKKLVTKTGGSQPAFPPVVITFDKDAKDKKPATVIKP